MKVIKLLVFLPIVGLSILFHACKVDEVIDLKDKVQIAIINPNVASLVGFQALIENGILNIPDARYIAVCYEKAERDVAAVENYCLQNKDLFGLEIIRGELSPSDLFHANQLSDQLLHVFQKTEGMFFLGGADIPPGIYEQKTNLLSSITTPNRHFFELSYLFHLLGGWQDTTFIPFLDNKPDYKVIGFCLGMQTMNVATGGSMYQDIPSEIYNKIYVEDILAMDNNQRHLNYWQKIVPDDDMIWSNFHQIKSVKPHNFFNERLWQSNNLPFVYSSHHQAVRTPGKDLEIIATSLDGRVVEIVAHQKFLNVMGVQFHPEVSSLYLSEQKKFRWSADDNTPRSYNDFLKERNSLQFHRDFWKQVGLLYQ